MAGTNDSAHTTNGFIIESNRETSFSSSSSSASPSLSSSSSTASSASEASHLNAPDLVQYRIQRFLHDPTFSTISVSQTSQATEQVIVQDAQRRMAVQLQAFDVAFDNTPTSGSSNTHAADDDPSNTEVSADSSTSEVDSKSADDEEESG